MFRNMTDTRLRLLIAIALVVVTVIAYWPVFGNKFVNYDDDRYVCNNPRVQDGLSVGGILWALRSTSNANWHPLTWMSHMLDSQIYGMRPMGHHATSLVLHVLNTLLLFLLLLRLTGTTWRSAFVAALFAVHPLHVESVAWVAERKDVLSTFFFMLTLLAYVRYVESRSIKRYLLVVGMFALGLMAKPMLVSVPFVLLMLDYWPLRRVSAVGADSDPRHANRSRIGIRSYKRGHGRPLKTSSTAPIAGLVLEKAPLFVMALGSCVITIIAQTSGGATNSMSGVPLGIRLSSVVAGYAAYTLQMVWPLRLGVIYPYPADGFPVWQILGAAALIAVISCAAFRERTRRPCLAMGWLWFVVTLVPVIGLIQVGSQFIADRYTYIPLIGLFVAIAYGIGSGSTSMSMSRSRSMGADRTPTPPHAHTPILPVLGLAVIAVLIPLTWRQVGYWKDGYTLFTHTLQVTAPSETAHCNLGIALAGRGDEDGAIKQYEMALQLNPEHLNSRYNLGNAYLRKKMYYEAVEQYQQAIDLWPDAVEAHVNLANAYSEMQAYDRAEQEYREALRLDSEGSGSANNLANNWDIHSSLGVALASQGKIDDALGEFEEAIRINPKFADGHANLANVYAARREFDRAAEEYKLAISLNPKIVEAHHNLGLVLRDLGDLDGAIAEFRRAVELDPSMPALNITLATALYAAGDFPGAWKQIHLCEANGASPPKPLVDALSTRMPDPGR